MVNRLWSLPPLSALPCDDSIRTGVLHVVHHTDLHSRSIGNTIKEDDRLKSCRRTSDSPEADHPTTRSLFILSSPTLLVSYLHTSNTEVRMEPTAGSVKMNGLSSD